MKQQETDRETAKRQLRLLRLNKPAGGSAKNLVQLLENRPFSSTIEMKSPSQPRNTDCLHLGKCGIQPKQDPVVAPPRSHCQDCAHNHRKPRYSSERIRIIHQQNSSSGVQISVIEERTDTGSNVNPHYQTCCECGLNQKPAECTVSSGADDTELDEDILPGHQAGLKINDTPNDKDTKLRNRGVVGVCEINRSSNISVPDDKNSSSTHYVSNDEFMISAGEGETADAMPNVEFFNHLSTEMVQIISGSGCQGD